MVSDQYRVAAIVDFKPSEDGGLSGFYATPVTSFVVEPDDADVLAGTPYDSFGAIVIDVVGHPDVRAGMTGVHVVITFLDGGLAQRRLRPEARFHLRLGSRRIGVGVVDDVVQAVRSAS